MSTKTFAVNTVQKGTDISIFSEMSAQDFLQMEAKDLEEITGKRVRLKDRYALIMTKRLLKKELKKGNEINISEEFKENKNGFSVVGFLLGFFLSFIGALLAWIFFKDGLKSALLGMLCSFIIILLSVLL
jgi:hypothetical protein